MNIVFGASGMVGSHITQQLGDHCTKVSRLASKGVGWLQADLARLDTIQLPSAPDIIFCATNARAFASAIAPILSSKPRRLVVISSTSVITKIDSSDAKERASTVELVAAEQSIINACNIAGTEYTILRPSLIYQEGIDKNVTQIAKLIRKLHFMPLCGRGEGLRQPIHAEDLALGAIAAGRSNDAANKCYTTAGLETLSYREMVGRIFDSIAMQRRLVSFPPLAWKAAFALAKPLYPGVTPVMGDRMQKNMVFDSSDAVSDFGWAARPFAPKF